MAERQRRRLVVQGVVQGVGFRPWAARQARELGLTGFAANDRRSLVLEIEGIPDALDAFYERVRSTPPPLAAVEQVEVATVPIGGSRAFTINASQPGTGPAGVVSPDVATCDACLAEIRDPESRRYGYPFTNCADCGPRYTIIRSVPFDRPATAMADFPLCRDCAAEHADPTDRRFHAEAIACPVCGPNLAWEVTGEEPSAHGVAALAAAAGSLAAGGVVAVKGLGGYHLAVLAADEAAVARLRARKARDDKPFAIMVASLDDAADLVDLDAAAVRELTSRRRPIVVAPRRDGVAIAAGVAPGLPELGVLLPYSPLHHLLLDAVDRPLVMTSGNRTDEPIAHDVDDARRQLSGIADGFLHHDRPIVVRCDDSVVRSVGGEVQLVRRSRGYAPEPMRLPTPSGVGVLAVGAELKSTIAVATGDHVVASHHLGDLEHPAAFAAFEQAIAHLVALTGVEPELVVHDLHPEYLSTKWALDQEHTTFGVQHHHAHVASCLVDHGRSDAVVGLAFDGLGFGSDGTLWGGELLVADLREVHRAGHLRPVPLPGGTAAIREPWRMALSWVALALGEEAAAALGPSLDPRWRSVLSLVAATSTPQTSSGGRLFDAIAALAVLRHTVTYEGQAAIYLEAAARSHLEEHVTGSCDGGWVGEAPGAGPWVMDPSPLVADVLASQLARRPAAATASAFHHDFAAGLARAATTLAHREGLTTVALTGGVFQNALLSSLVASSIASAGLEVLVHRMVPANDAGISIGQAAIAAATP